MVVMLQLSTREIEVDVLECNDGLVEPSGRTLHIVSETRNFGLQEEQEQQAKKEGQEQQEKQE